MLSGSQLPQRSSLAPHGASSAACRSAIISAPHYRAIQPTSSNQQHGPQRWRRRSLFHRASATHQDQGLVTLEELQQIAASRCLELTTKVTGPFYRIVCRDTALSITSRSGGRAPSSAERAAEEAAAGAGGSGRVLAVSSGFLVPPPVGLMHCDTLQTFARGQRGEEGLRLRGGVMGLGLLMGCATFAFGLSQGCRKAEILAINDDEAWHQRLVRYYSRFGFQPVRVVRGNSLADLPDMLVWGGAGTRMDGDVEAMLRRWTQAVRQNSAAAAATGAGAAASTAAATGGELESRREAAAQAAAQHGD